MYSPEYKGLFRKNSVLKDERRRAHLFRNDCCKLKRCADWMRRIRTIGPDICGVNIRNIGFLIVFLLKLNMFIQILQKQKTILKNYSYYCISSAWTWHYSPGADGRKGLC